MTDTKQTTSDATYTQRKIINGNTFCGPDSDTEQRTKEFINEYRKDFDKLSES